jgi:fatty acid-binding protein DegV
MSAVTTVIESLNASVSANTVAVTSAVEALKNDDSAAIESAVTQIGKNTATLVAAVTPAPAPVAETKTEA